MRNKNSLARTVLMLLLIALSGGAAFAQVSTRVMTWNAHGRRFCSSNQDRCPMRTPTEMDNLVKVIRASNAGIVNLQEVFRPQADYIARNLLGGSEGCYQDRGIAQAEHVTGHVQRPVHCYFVAAKEYGSNPDFGNAIISFRPIIETTARRIHTQHDPHITDCRNKGDVVDELCDGTFAKLAGVTINADGHLLRVYTVHLTANPADPKERERQVDWQVRDILEAIAKDDHRAVNKYRAVLTGDFNFEPPADVKNPPPGPYRRLFEKFEDAAVKSNLCPPGSPRSCGATEPAPTTQHPANVPHRRIDYLFLYRGSGFNLISVRVLRTEPCTGPNGTCLSDHLPVTATLSF